MSNKLLKYYEDVALSNFDIMKLLDNKCNIVLYPELYKYDSIDQILQPYNACILLFEAKPRYGHWVCLIKRDDGIEFFNSYGGFPDDSLKHIQKDFAEETNQDIPYLSLLLYDSPYSLHYNEFPFQKKSNDVKTCGRHCVFRIINKDLDIYEYKHLLDKLSEKYDVDYDGIVTMLTIN